MTICNLLLDTSPLHLEPRVIPRITQRCRSGIAHLSHAFEQARLAGILQQSELQTGQIYRRRRIPRALHRFEQRKQVRQLQHRQRRREFGLLTPLLYEKFDILKHRLDPAGHQQLAFRSIHLAAQATLHDFLARIEEQYGRARRIWTMDRGIPTEAVLTEMRESDPPVHYLVGTPKGRLSRFEKALLAQSWQEARPGVDVKLLPRDGELYVYAQSRDRVAKERAIRRRKLKRLWARLTQFSAMTLTREALLMKLGAARQKDPSAWRLVEVKLDKKEATFRYRLRRDKLRQARRREGRYLLRTNLTETDPAKLWHFYLQLVAVEEAFKNLKGDLAIRPVFHQLDRRIEAHIFIAFLAYCLHVTLNRRLHPLAPGLTPRTVIEKFAAVQMLDVHIPTTDGRGARPHPLHPA